MKVLDFISKHHIAIIACLFTLLLGKSCQSCTRKNTIAWNEVNTKNTVDSLTRVNATYKDSILFLNARNTILQNELDGCKVEVEKLKEQYNNINSINKSIQNTNNKLINKLTEKEL